ncbi:MAG: S-methyl-5-thioribose-1-phosphate isomerase [Gemmatimonadota bacterium]
MPLPAWTHIAWLPGHGVRILDQTRLPTEEIYLDLTTVDAMAEAIHVLRVRGAPLIGIAGAMGLTLTRSGGQGGAGAEARVVLADLESSAVQLKSTRPTAVNLGWALDRVMQRAHQTPGGGPEIRAAVRAEAEAIWAEDRAMCDLIGEVGLHLVPDGATIYTHCNAGALATGGRGTALAPVYTAFERGRRVQVLADETRPLLQGSRLTAWELGRVGIPCTVLADGMAASRLRMGGVAAVIVGADRIAANGDTANKIGTYGLALAARAHGVPFYIAAPYSTFDIATPDGAAIPIEQRDSSEVTRLGGIATAPATASAWNPAFDVTPVGLITGFITDRGLLAPTDLSGRLTA